MVVAAIQGQHVTSLIKQKVTQSLFQCAALENLRLNTIEGFTECLWQRKLALTSLHAITPVARTNKTKQTKSMYTNEL